MMGKYKLIYIAVLKESSWIKYGCHHIFHYIECLGIKRHFPIPSRVIYNINGS